MRSQHESNRFVNYDLYNLCAGCNIRYPKALESCREMYITNGRRYCGKCGRQIRTRAASNRSHMGWTRY